MSIYVSMTFFKFKEASHSKSIISEIVKLRGSYFLNNFEKLTYISEIQ